MCSCSCCVPVISHIVPAMQSTVCPSPAVWQEVTLDYWWIFIEWRLLYKPHMLWTDQLQNDTWQMCGWKTWTKSLYQHIKPCDMLCAIKYVWVLTGRQMSESEGWSCVHASTPSAAFCLTLEIVLCLVMCPDIWVNRHKRSPLDNPDWSCSI